MNCYKSIKKPFINVLFTYFCLQSFIQLANGHSMKAISANDVILKYDQFQGNRKWRKDIPGAYRTRWGLQFDQTCFQKSANKNKTIRKLESWADEALEAVITKCGAVYPELHSYVKEWFTQFRRAVIICESEGTLDYFAYTADYPFEETPAQKIKIHPQHYFKRTKIAKNKRQQSRQVIGKKKTLDENHEPTYVFGPFTMYDVSALIHEIFHSTSANSHPLHSLKEADSKSAEEAIKKLDRVYALQDLCSPSLPKKSERIVEQLLNPNISSCVKVFTDKIRHYPEILSKPLSNQDALQFCNKLEKQKNCYLHFKPQKILNEKNMNALLAAYRDEALQYLSQWDGHVPKKAQDLLPTDLRERLQFLLEKNKGNECFKDTLFLDPTNGDLTYKNFYKKGFDFKQKNIQGIGYCGQPFIRESCEESDELKEALNILNNTSYNTTYLGEGIGSLIFTDLDYMENDFYSSSETWKNVAQQKLNLTIQSNNQYALLSEKLIEKLKELPGYFDQLEQIEKESLECFND